MEDVLEVYHRPHDPKRPQLTMDELSKQLIAEVRRPLPAEPGKPKRLEEPPASITSIRETARQTFHAIRRIAVFEPLTGRRIVEVTERRTMQDWAHLMRDLVDRHYPEAETIVLVCDNLNTHVKASLYQAFPPAEAKRIADRLEIHYTPKHGSWLNAAECELSHLSRQCLHRRIPDMASLKEEVAAWQQARNHDAKAMDWQFTVDSARIKLKRLYPQYQT